MMLRDRVRRVLASRQVGWRDAEIERLRKVNRSYYEEWCRSEGSWGRTEVKLAHARAALALVRHAHAAVVFDTEEDEEAKRRVVALADRALDESREYAEPEAA